MFLTFSISMLYGVEKTGELEYLEDIPSNSLAPEVFSAMLKALWTTASEYPLSLNLEAISMASVLKFTSLLHILFNLRI